jgi:hypothetical protein
MINKKAKGGGIIAIVLILLAVGIYFFYFAPKNDFQDNPIANQINKTISQVINNQTNQSITNQTSYHSILPSVSGDVLTDNLSIICVTGYTTTVRDVPQSLREAVFARDNVPYPQPTGTTELDHIIPLEIGGSNAENNLFVEFAEPIPGFHEKDKLENYLHDHVCNGEINIDYAQQRIAQDWYSYYLEIYGQPSS